MARVHPVSTNDELVAELIGVVSEVRDLLRDRLPGPAPTPAPGTVELREPERPTPGVPPPARGRVTPSAKKPTTTRRRG